MTQNQIAYAVYREGQRHNKAYEVETNRHNLATETETHRSNVVYENETIRHNKQSEANQITVANIAAGATIAAAGISASAYRYATDKNFELGTSQLQQTRWNNFQTQWNNARKTTNDYNVGMAGIEQKYAQDASTTERNKQTNATTIGTAFINGFFKLGSSVLSGHKW